MKCSSLTVTVTVRQTQGWFLLQIQPIRLGQFNALVVSM